MRRELPGGDWDALGMGTLAGPDGRTYRRRATRLTRHEVEPLVESGCPVATYLPGGRVVWHDEDDAWPAWADARTALTTGDAPGAGGQSVTASRWASPAGAVAVVLAWRG
ncbi:hypothetical protein [Blastococcus sp. VKM Ac-2987]|uniref:hypothetical protein n=1 Tax=Blastococcus sp. VKM Ac-2987 TaxID=3004141 RepID=UPI0022ABAF0E|nr:hypothetical protein [Blastococcus sp. VKM Ac-2987]MCZ2860255.1 hypothetical protein [Blastococcus sp. VKM Ac-2987]